MSVSRRFRILQVNVHTQIRLLLYAHALRTDCPEREATYVITNGGINDPEKV